MSTTAPAKGPAKATTKRRRKRREWPYRLAVTLLVLAGIAVTLFPVVGTYYNNWHAMQAANRAIAEQSQSKDLEHWLALAHRYNSTLPPGGVSDPWTGTDQTRSPAYKDYLSQLSSGDVMARLRIPGLKVSLPVRHGTTEQVLDEGAGHMYGTSLPVGGKGTHAAIAAHRGLPNMTAFDHLPDMKVGDEFFIDVYGQTLAYKVTRILTVLPTDTKPLARTAGKDQVTMITCTPYGINSHRLLVTGDRIPLSQANQADLAWHSSFDWTIQRWMYLRLAIALAALLLLAALAVKWKRDDRRRARRLAALRARKAAEALAAEQAARPGTCACGQHTCADAAPAAAGTDSPGTTEPPRGDAAPDDPTTPGAGR